MPVEISWVVPQRIVSVRFYGVVDLADVQAQIDQTEPMIEAGTAPVHFFIDSTGVEKYTLTLNQIRSAFPPRSPKSGWTVIYGPSAVTRFFASIMMQIIKGNFQFVSSYDEAVVFIRHNDSSLPNFAAPLPVD